LGVRDGGEGEEREEEDLGKILPWVPLLLCVQAQEDKGKGLEMEREQREREGWSARVAILVGLQREGEEKRREEEERRVWPKFT
jgi:hypothetical protein